MESVNILNRLRKIIILYATPKFVYLNKFVKTSRSNYKIKVLDVGCGNRSPSTTISLFPQIEYYGLDKEDYNLTIEDKKILLENNRYFKVDLENLSQLDNSLPDNYFDFIIMNHVIEHTISGLDILKILVKKVKVGGGIYIEFPSVKSLSFPSMPGTLNFCDDDTHVRLYDLKEIANVLLESGLKVIKGGTRRNLVSIIVMPVKVIYHILKYRKILGSAFWDISGFSEYIYAIKKRR